MPEEVRAIMGKATQEFRKSGILDRTIKVGDTLPAFSLVNADGATINSADLLSKGAVVLTVFRSHW
jgi:peroxiredoxin